MGIVRAVVNRSRGPIGHKFLYNIVLQRRLEKPDQESKRELFKLRTGPRVFFKNGLSARKSKGFLFVNTRLTSLNPVQRYCAQNALLYGLKSLGQAIRVSLLICVTGAEHERASFLH